MDPEKRGSHIRYQVQRMRDDSGPIEARPKQDEQSTVPFGESTAAALKAHRLRHNEERLARVPLDEDRDLVFAKDRGTPSEASYVVKRSFKPLLQKAGAALGEASFETRRHPESIGT
ncbi:MAG TPA: hypothetical protein VE568_07205 [Rubrobacter sp.]|nr:hypothetical protein [Rubrobacter sp.]